MKTLKQLMLFTGVIILFDTSLAQNASNAQDTSLTTLLGAIGQGNVEKGSYEAEEVIKKSCNDALSAMNTALVKAKEACTKSGNAVDGGKSTKSTENMDKLLDSENGPFQKCVKAAAECSALTENEPDAELDGKNGTLLGLAGSMAGIPGLADLFKDEDPDTASKKKGQCYGRKDFNDELRTAKRELKDSEDDVSKIQKDISDTQKDLTDADKKAREELADLSESARKEDLENAESKRSQEADMAKAQAETKASMSSINLEIIQAQGSLAQAISKRTQSLLEMTDAMIERRCLTEAEEARIKGAALNVGSASSLIRQSSQSVSYRNQDFKKCLIKMQSFREETRAAYQAQIDGINATIDAKSAEARDLQKNLALGGDHQAQRDAENAVSQQQIAVTRDFKQKNITNAQQMNQFTTSQRLSELSQRLQAAQKRNNDASARLAFLGTEPAGDMAPDEGSKAFDEFTAAYSTCESTCSQLKGVSGSDYCRGKNMAALTNLGYGRYPTPGSAPAGGSSNNSNGANSNSNSNANSAGSAASGKPAGGTDGSKK